MSPMDSAHKVHVKRKVCHVITPWQVSWVWLDYVCVCVNSGCKDNNDALMLGKLRYRQYALLVFNLALSIMCRTRSRHDKRIIILIVSRFLGYLCLLSLVEIQCNISSRNLFHQRCVYLQFKFNGKFELLCEKPSDRHTFVHISRQHNCRDMCRNL